MESSLFNVEDKVIAITGGGGILGNAMAEALAGAGAKIALLDRDPNGADTLLSKAQQNGWTVKAYKTDVLDEQIIKKTFDEVITDFQKVDVLINAAGGNMPGATVGPDQSVLDLSISEIRKVLELNYLGTVIPTQALLTHMIENKAGNIINISSMSAQTPLTRVMGYSSSKAAIDNYTKWMAVELAGKFGEGFRVNALAPGFFLTKQNEALLTQANGSLTDRGRTIIEHTPFKRFGTPGELAGTLIWLISDASKFVTGAIVPIDGGFNAFSGV